MELQLAFARVLYSTCLPRLITEAIQLCFFFFCFLFPCKGKTTICTAAGWAPVELLEPAPLTPVAFVCAGRQTRLAAAAALSDLVRVGWEGSARAGIRGRWTRARGRASCLDRRGRGHDLTV